jgi:hypothetical protein
VLKWIQSALTSSIRELLRFWLSVLTQAGATFSHHKLGFLLQREMLSFIPDKFLPIWFSTSHVFHINGTVEEAQTDHALRSPVLLTEDHESQRTSSIEADIAF